MNKKEFRTRMRTVRKEVLRKDEKSAQICRSVRELPVWQNAKTVGIYVSLPDEVSTGELIRSAWAEGKTVSVPRIRENGRMDMVRIDSEEDLTTQNRLSIPEPSGKLPAVSPETIDCMIVPGLAFDKEGHRLGQGGGFYDRYLPQVPGVKIAVAFDAQITDSIPFEKHDVPMDIIVTESRRIQK